MRKIIIGTVVRLREKKKGGERILKGKMRHERAGIHGKMRHERAGIHEENPEYRPSKKL